MKSRDSALPFQRFKANELSRNVQGLEQMITEFEQMASALERQIQAEEERTHIRDRGHFSYSTVAAAATQRRTNLLASINGLKLKLEDARRDRDELLAELAAAETTERPAQEQSRRGPARAGRFPFVLAARQ